MLKILLEIGFIEEMRTTRGNKEVPQTFFHISHSSRKIILIRLTPYHWQPCISQFCDISKGLLYISTGSLGLQVLVAGAKFSDLVIGYTHCNQLVFAFLSLRYFLQNYASCNVTKFRNAWLPMVASEID